MQLLLLADYPQALPVVARWYFAEWAYISNAASVDVVQAALERYLNTDRIPLMVVAVDGADVIGAATLRYNNMRHYPEKEHWLGGVYVSADHRNKGVATQLIRRIIALAEVLDVKVLHLLTEDLSGGLYSKLGWQPIERLQYLDHEFLVMENTLGGH